MKKTVAILGGGVAGLTAAHELALRGFGVHLYERRPGMGGKARSIPVQSGRGKLKIHPGDSSPMLPGEHGFRFIPGFYKHLPDTMARIPVGSGSVADNLVLTRDILIAPSNAPPTRLLAGFPTRLREILASVTTLPALLGLEIPPDEWLFFADRMFQLLSSCPERRLAEYEKISWWDFVKAEVMSPAYRQYLCVGLTRALVAMRAEIASTRTIGNIMLQLVIHSLERDGKLDRVLNGPTNEVWIDPWIAELQRLGVVIHPDTIIQRFRTDVSRITGVEADSQNVSTVIHADYFLSALPVEGLLPLLDPALLRLVPTLRGLPQLQVSWMNGLQLFLREDDPIAFGHTNLVDSPWALTLISQAQFWKRRPEQYGEGEVRGILSVDISNWDEPGILFGKAAKELETAEEIYAEVLAQLRAGLGDRPTLRDSNILGWFLDPAIQPGPGESQLLGHGGGRVSNQEPLLVNTADSWKDRPDAVTAVPNFFLAGDYVRTHTDLATMEGANEAARRAVNGILQQSGEGAERCGVWEHAEPSVFGPLRARDFQRFKDGKPWRHPLSFRGRRAA